ncbi:5-bromo-4-chloroindolyl phosphate hydrolysis family protein [Clostridium chromiireducens]|uniref:5-bromo-4-chloroindolyl phosphate hydrolysis protein n=1 Tax=Clostridium chromiireducens TaxID=225345 RepID=A0A1V4IW86_9CLOT|nr:5-bromo-4-chloroindolyl phosphate hydrolysis family protein [Clostridium chromiireducens]OPJ64312.1 5-bromo-4-chloroindolyl phosphate hydrolysis protein [Clostridium chromiireducens]
MGRRDFSDLEEEIRETVKNAFDAIDFARIKKDVDDKTADAINEVKTTLKDKSYHYNKKIKEKVKNKYRDMGVTKKEENKMKMYIAKRPAGSISGIIYTVFGAILSGLFGITLISISISSYFISGFSTVQTITLSGLFALFVPSVGLTLKGISLRKRIKRFRQYIRSLNSNNYCSIEELAVSIKKKNKYVMKDLRKMIDLGMFPQGHIDDKKTYFMLSDEVYENYLASQEALKMRNEEELKRQEQLKQEVNDPAKKELRTTIEMGRNHIEQIKSVNDAIPEEEISVKLSRLQNIVAQIFKHVEQNPKKLPEVSKFINHYLPMTLKLVNSYKELNDQPVHGENIKNAKNEIEKTIDIINFAFENLLDDLFEEIALDISTDISVLETLLTQEGLTKNDFEK